MILKGFVDHDDVGRLGRCGRKCSEDHECEGRDKRDRRACPCHDLNDTMRFVPRTGNSRRKYGDKFPATPPFSKTAAVSAIYAAYRLASWPCRRRYGATAS